MIVQRFSSQSDYPDRRCNSSHEERSCNHKKGDNISKENKKIIHKAIAANLDALSQRLAQAAVLAKEAHEAMEAGEQNQAIGTVLEFERLLPEEQALFSAALVLHRNHP